MAWGEPPDHLQLTHSGLSGKPSVQIRSLQRRLKNRVGQEAIKTGLMPLTNEGLKVKDELSASRRDGRYLCLSGKSAFPPLGAEPSTFSSPCPYSAICGVAAGSHCPQSTFSKDHGRGAGREAARFVGEGLAPSSQAHICTGSPSEGSHPRQQASCQTRSAVASKASQGVCTLSWQLRLTSTEENR